MFKKTLIAASLAVSFAASNAYAVTISGDDVDFSFDETLLDALFGGYSVSGNTLSFDPTTFVAKATAPGFLSTNATTPLITVTAHANYVLTGASLYEDGDYYRIDNASGTDTVVGAGGQFRVNNVPVTFTAGGLSSFLTVPQLASNGLSTTPWSAAAWSGISNASSATIKLENILLAGITGGLQTAFIEKKLIEISIETHEVPVPAAVWLFGSAVVGLATVSRRRIKA